MPYYAPNILTKAVESDGVIDMRPAPGFNARIFGRRTAPGNAAIGSLWIDTDTDNAINADYSQLRLTRAGVAKWRFGNNLAGDGNDLLSCYSDVAGLYAWTINPTTRVMDFKVTPTVNGSTLGGVPSTGGTYTGKVVVGIGALSTATSTENPVSASQWVTNLGNNTPITAYGPNAWIACFANTDGTNSANPSGKIRYGTIGLGADNGFHMDQNLAYFPSGTSPKLFDPTLPRGNVGFDHDGTFSYSWDPAAVAGSGYDYRAGLGDRSNSPYVPQSNQSFVIYGQGITDGAGAFDYGKVVLATMRAGQTMRFATSNAAASPYTAMEITANNSSAPGNVNIMRLLVLGVGGISGVPHMKFQNSVSIGSPPGSGFLWWDGSVLKFDQAGTIKTLSWT